MDLEINTLHLSSRDNVSKGSTRTKFSCLLPSPLVLDTSKKWYICLSEISMSCLFDGIFFDSENEEMALEFRLGYRNESNEVIWKMEFDIRFSRDEVLHFVNIKDVVDYIRSSKVKMKTSIHNTVTCYTVAAGDLVDIDEFLIVEIKNNSIVLKLNQKKPLVMLNFINIGQVKSPEKLDHLFSFPWKVFHDGDVYDRWYGPPHCNCGITDVEYVHTHSTFDYFDGLGNTSPIDLENEGYTYRIKKHGVKQCNPLKNLAYMEITCDIVSPSLTNGFSTLYTFPLASCIKEQISNTIHKEIKKLIWLDCPACSINRINIALTNTKGQTFRILDGRHTELKLMIAGVNV